MRKSCTSLSAFCTARPSTFRSCPSSRGFNRYRKASTSYASNTYLLLDVTNTSTVSGFSPRNSSAVFIPSSPSIRISRKTMSKLSCACNNSFPLLNCRTKQGTPVSSSSSLIFPAILLHSIIESSHTATEIISRTCLIVTVLPYHSIYRHSRK